MESYVVSAIIIAAQFALGALWWSVRAQITSLRQDIQQLRNDALSRQEFLMWLKGRQNGKSKT